LFLGASVSKKAVSIELSQKREMLRKPPHRKFVEMKSWASG